MAHDRSSHWKFDTRLVHEGELKQEHGARPTAMPVYATSTFVHPTADDLDRAFDENGLVYGRYGNPTVDGFEEVVAAVEGGVGAVAFGSGMAALHGALLAAATPRGSMYPTPSSILAGHALYGTTRTLLHFLAAQGWSVRYCDMTDLDQVAMHLREPTAIVLFESISNPLLQVYDIAGLTSLAHEAGARVIVDNTLASPVLLRPIEHGTDLVVHSATKYLGGHGDAIGGVVTARSHLLHDALRRYSKLLGPTLGPFEARLLARGMKTLTLRVKQQSANAMVVAQWLQQHDRVDRVYYPGLADHPQHALATQFFGELYGGMVSFDLFRADQPAVFQFMDALHLILPATTLGDVYSLVSYSARSSHRDMTADERRQQGIGDGLLRLSIGIEDVDDICADLEQALAAVA